MDQLKSFYIVLDQEGGEWGKGLDLAVAKSNAGYWNVKNRGMRFKSIQFILKEDTPNDVVENLSHCYQVDAYGSVVFYNGKTPEWEKDKKQADEYILGYVTFVI